jgi:oligoendopeptidase F
LANITDGFYSSKVLFHEIGHALHFTFIRQQNPLFKNMMDGAWVEGIAQTVSAMMLEPIWLNKYAHMPDHLIDQYNDAKKDQDIIKLRTNLLRLNFEFEIYKNPNRDLNELYWNLFEKYMKLPRHDDLYPWASEIYYTTHPVYIQNYLLADIIAAQNVSYIKDNFGSIIDNEMTRSFLVQNYLRFGARYSWQDLLKRGTDQSLDPDYFLNGLGLIP